MRNIYNRDIKTLKTITQGSIFEGAVASDYSCFAWGVIITPRCDIANEAKVSHIHYLPIVPLNEWLALDGRLFMYQKKRAKELKKLYEKCKEYNLPSSVSRDLLEQIIDKIQTEKPGVLQIRPLLEYLHCENQDDYQMNKSERRDLLQNLIGGKLNAYYFIESWIDPDAYFVVLLKDLQRLSLGFAKSLADGIVETPELHDSNDIASGRDEPLLYAKCAQLQSPFVEHIMQQFSSNFCRIGVEDIKDRATLHEKL